MTLRPILAWKRLRRLATCEKTVEDLVPIMRRLECLETTILAWPFRFRLKGLLSGRWVRGGGRAQELVIPVTPYDDTDKVADQFMASLEDEEGVDGEGRGRGVLKLMHVPEVGPERTWTTWEVKRHWFRQVVLDGSIWERERSELAVYIQPVVM